MEVPEDILKKACSGCPRLEAGNCPFLVSEKDYCKRVREEWKNTFREKQE